MKAKLVSENINSFVRNQDPIKSLSLGYETTIRNFFRQYNIPDNHYEVKRNGEIVFNRSLYLNNINISEFPEYNYMYIDGNLNLSNTNIFKLPNNLFINGFLDIFNTKITELPEDLTVNTFINVNKDQIELINWIK